MAGMRQRFSGGGLSGHRAGFDLRKIPSNATTTGRWFWHGARNQRWVQERIVVTPS
jgi:hypothetical protein